MKTHKDLRAWQFSIQLAQRIYVLTSKYPPDERFGLTSQMRRAAVSIAANIAEGAARQSTREFLHFLHVARGSVSELRTEVEISRSIGMIPEPAFLEVARMIDRQGRLVQGLIRAVGNTGRRINV